MEEGLRIKLGLDTTKLESDMTALQSRIKSFSNSFGNIVKTDSFNALNKAINDAKANLATFKPVAIKADGSQLSKTLGQLQSQLKNFQNGLSSATSVESINRLNRAIEVTQQRINALRGGTPYQGYVKGSNEAIQTSTNLGRVLQDLPYGFMGVANNLNPLLETFQRLKATTGSTGGALKALAGSLAGPGGVGLALSAFQFFALGGVDALKKMFTASKDAEDGFNSAADAIGKAGGEFQTAFTDVNRLRVEIDLAKKGLIEKKDVVDSYNTALGETIGKANNLDQVEKKIAASGDAYIKFTLAKAAATLSFGEASKKALEIAKKLNEPITTSQLISGSKRGELTQQAEQTEEYQAAHKKWLKAFLEGNKEADSLLKVRDAIVTKYLEKNIDPEATKQMDVLTQIGNDFVKQQAELAKKFNLNFTPDIKVGKGETKKFDFFENAIDFDPNKAKLKAEEAKELYKTAIKYAFENQEFFIGLEAIIKAPNREKAIEEARKWWNDFQKGVISFKPPVISADETNVDVPVYYEPKSQNEGELKGYINSEIARITGATEDLYISADLTVKISSITDTIKDFQTKFKDAGLMFPVGIKLDKDTNPEDVKKFYEDLFNQQVAIKEFLTSSLTPAFSELFENIGSGGANAMQAFGQAIKKVITQLIAQMAALAAISLILSAIPGFGSFGALFKGGFEKMMGFKIPGFKRGLRRVPDGYNNDTYLARLSSGEMVVPAGQSEQKKWARGVLAENGEPVETMPDEKLKDFENLNLSGVMNNAASMVKMQEAVNNAMQNVFKGLDLSNVFKGFEGLNISLAKMPNFELNMPDITKNIASSGVQFDQIKPMQTNVYLNGNLEIDGKKLKFLIDDVTKSHNIRF